LTAGDLAEVALNRGDLVTGDLATGDLTKLGPA
jgi:hypothetical protein